MNQSVTSIRLATAGVILATFVLGAAVGAGAYRWLRPHHRPPPMLPLSELNLTPDQDRAARDIIERRRPELQAILQETFPKVRALHDDVERDVRKLLTPEQQKKLDELKARHPKHGDHGDHGPGGGAMGMPGLFAEPHDGHGGPPPGLPPGPPPP